MSLLWEKKWKFDDAVIYWVLRLSHIKTKQLWKVIIQSVMCQFKIEILNRKTVIVIIIKLVFHWSHFVTLLSEQLSVTRQGYMLLSITKFSSSSNQSLAGSWGDCIILPYSDGLRNFEIWFKMSSSSVSDYFNIFVDKDFLLVKDNIWMINFCIHYVFIKVS